MAYQQRQHGAIPSRPRYDSYRPPQNDLRVYGNSRRQPSPPAPPKSPSAIALRTLESSKASPEEKQRAFKELLDLAKQDSLRNTKALAKNFAGLSQDQQEEVIDFVYDLCEDPDDNVRKHGYETIVQLSKQSLNWTRRNTDVLVQLLQSDSPEELRIIRHSLISHMEIDPSNAFDVMAEHCVRSGEAEVEGQQGGGLIKGLVLDFLEAEPARHVRQKKLTRGSEAEQAFYNRMTEAILVSNQGDVSRMLALVEALPSTKPSPSTSRPNHFLTLVLTSILRRALSVSSPRDTSQPYKPTAETLHFYNVARDVSKDGMGDSRVFLRFWTEVPWGDSWSSLQGPEFGSPLLVNSWLKESIPIWDRPPSDEEESMSEPKLGQSVLNVLLDLLDSVSRDAVNLDARNRAQMWTFIDEVYVLLGSLTARPKIDSSALKEMVQTPNVRQMIRFVMTTKDQRGTGLSPETMNKLRSIASSADSLLRNLGLPGLLPTAPGVPKRVADRGPDTPVASRREAPPQPTRPVSLKRNQLGKPKPDANAAPEAKAQQPSSHVLPARPKADLLKAEQRDAEDQRPRKKQKTSPPPKLPTPTATAAAPTLLARMAIAANGVKPSQSSAPSLLDRLALPTQAQQAARNSMSIKGAADQRPSSLLARIQPANPPPLNPLPMNPLLNISAAEVEDGGNRFRRQGGGRRRG